MTPVLMSRKPRKEESGRSLHSGRSVSLIGDDGDERVVYADMNDAEWEKGREAAGRGSWRRGRGGVGGREEETVNSQTLVAARADCLCRKGRARFAAVRDLRRPSHASSLPPRCTPPSPPPTTPTPTASCAPSPPCLFAITVRHPPRQPLPT